MPNHSIINNAINKPANQYKAPVTKPVTTQVNAANETVESRLNKITSKGSAYTRLAGQDARREANSRGLINSSMAAAAGTEAAIRSALPIAQQDAKTYSATRINNQGIQNKFLGNRQKANLTQETSAQNSNLKRGEMKLGDTLQQSQNAQKSTLRQGEMRLGDTLQQSQNAQNANLNIKVNAAQSALTNQENTLLNKLQMKRDSGLSQLTQAEQAQLNALQIKRDKNSAQLNQNTAAFKSGLTQTENAQLNALQMKRDQGISALTQSENAQLNALQIKRDSAQSGNTIAQQNNQSGNTIAQQNNQSGNTIAQQNNQAGLNTVENEQLNALQMKRDAGQSTLTQAEQAQLNALQIKRDSAQSQNIQSQQAQANKLAINRDALSAKLNENLTRLENSLNQSNMKLDAGLKLSLEQMLQSGRFSDQVKINAMNAIENIYTNLQSQITQVGLSNKTAAQQAAAIDMLRKNAAAETKTYQAILTNSVDWIWGKAPGNSQKKTTPDPVLSKDPAVIAAEVAKGSYTDRASVPGGGRSFTTSVGGSVTTPISEDLKWSWSPSKNAWEPYDQSRNVHTGTRTYL